MKLTKLSLQNFRGIEALEMDLYDELGRVESVIPIVGPNTSGKTTILDAISLCLWPAVQGSLRADLALTPTALVRHGAVRAEVTCELWFSDEEIESVLKVHERTNTPLARPIPTANKITVQWTYPDPKGQDPRGRYVYLPEDSQPVFRGRDVLARNLHAPKVSWQQQADMGGVFVFDQKRTGIGEGPAEELRVPTGGGGLNGSGSWVSVAYLVDPFLARLTEQANSRQSQNKPRSPRDLLIDLATRAQAPQAPGSSQREDFERLKELYAKVCAPHRIRGLLNTGPGLDLEFEGPGGPYLFLGLSSGQLMILLILLQFAQQRIHRSIVLIDELELHLHPLWQTRLYQSLRELGDDNQIFFTTHSTHLRELIRQGTFFHTTGELGDHSIEKVEV